MTSMEWRSSSKLEVDGICKDSDDLDTMGSGDNKQEEMSYLSR